MVFGYYFNRAWTFESDSSVRIESIKYVLVYLCSLGISLVVLRILVENVKMDPRLANVIVIGITTVTNFVGTKFLVFKK